MKLALEVGPEIFSFHSFEEWVNKARSWYAPYAAYEVISIDSVGRVATRGAEFMRARDEGTFPIRVYLIDPMAKPRELSGPQMTALIEQRQRGLR